MQEGETEPEWVPTDRLIFAVLPGLVAPEGDVLLQTRLIPTRNKLRPARSVTLQHSAVRLVSEIQLDGVAVTSERLYRPGNACEHTCCHNCWQYHCGCFVLPILLNCCWTSVAPSLSSGAFRPKPQLVRDDGRWCKASSAVLKLWGWGVIGCHVVVELCRRILAKPGCTMGHSLSSPASKGQEQLSSKQLLKIILTHHSHAALSLKLPLKRLPLPTHRKGRRPWTHALKWKANSVGRLDSGPGSG